jgi:hypothetical protein
MINFFMLSFLFYVSANANYGVVHPDYFTLKKVTHIDLTNGRSVTKNITNYNSKPCRNLFLPDNRDFDFTEIINLGEKAWEIIKSNQPVLEFNTKSAMAIPKAAASPNNMENWNMPVSRDYQVIYENGFGMDVVTFHYKIIFTPGGSFEGRGQYLANASVHPVDVSVSWGYTFNANVEIGELINSGTKDDPLAGMQLNIVWDVSTIIKKNKGGDYYFAKGDGELLVL